MAHTAFYGRTPSEFSLEHSQWAAPEEFEQYVFPKPQLKLVEQLKKNHKVDKHF